MILKSILEQLYCSELLPNLNKLTKQQLADHRKAYHSYDLFRQSLPQEQKEEFEKLIEEYLAVFSSDTVQSFTDGFSLGVRLMAEVYLPKETL